MLGATAVAAADCKPHVQTPAEIAFCAKITNRGKPECLKREGMHQVERYDPRFQVNLCEWQLANGEIYNGKVPKPDEYSSTALLTLSPPPISQTSVKQVCSGTLIAKRVVITARHCLFPNSGGFVTKGAFVSFGPNHKQLNSTIEVADTAEIDIAGVDIGLVLLKSPAPASVPVMEIAAPQTINRARGVRIVGFGYTELYDDSTSIDASRGDLELIGQKRYADVVVASPNCAGTLSAPLQDDPVFKTRTDREFYQCAKDIEFTAANIDYADTCGGDSGGPVYVASVEENKLWRKFDAAMQRGRYFLGGVTSAGIPDLKRSAGAIRPKCGIGGIYTLLEGDTVKKIVEQAAAWNQTVKIAVAATGSSDQ
jgi:hypothetical protein